MSLHCMHGWVQQNGCNELEAKVTPIYQVHYLRDTLIGCLIIYEQHSRTWTASIGNVRQGRIQTPWAASLMLALLA